MSLLAGEYHIPKPLHQNQSQCYVMTDGQLASLPSWAQDKIFVTVRQLRVCWCGAPFLTRGVVWHIILLLALNSAVIPGSKSCGTHDNIYCLRFETSQTWRAKCLYLSTRNRIPFLSPPMTHRATLEVFKLTPTCGHCTKSKSESELLYDWQLIANQFILASTPLRLVTKDTFSNWTVAVVVLM
jgi:hypothetical protein